MDQIFNCLWSEQNYNGHLILLTIVSAAVLALIHYRYQQTLKQLITDSPYSVFVIDAGHGQILLANDSATQFLGIRALGAGFLYPATFHTNDLLTIVSSFASRSFRQQLFDWHLSESESTRVELSGRKSFYNGHRVWILYAQPYQATSVECQQEQAELNMARSALDSLSELVCLQAVSYTHLRAHETQ